MTKVEMEKEIFRLKVEVADQAKLTRAANAGAREAGSELDKMRCKYDHLRDRVERSKQSINTVLVTKYDEPFNLRSPYLGETVSIPSTKCEIEVLLRYVRDLMDV